MGILDSILAVFRPIRIPAAPGPIPVPEPHPTDGLPAADNDLRATPVCEEEDRVGGIVPPPDRYVDRRPFAAQQHVYGRRDWSKVTGICLHQTACVLGERDARWNGIGCHVGVTRSGKVLHLHDFDKLVVHGNGWNTQTVGIEIDGMYAGVEGDIRTFWRPKDEPNRQPQRLTPETIIATKQLIRWICDQVRQNGGEVRALVAHRQASKNRRSDPGSAIWQEIALPMSEELDLSDGGHGFRIGTGYAIPEAWDPRRKGIKY